MHLRGWPALLFLGYYLFWVPSLWTQSISTWEQKERLCIIYNVSHLFLQPSSLHWEISEVWQIWGRTNSLVIPSDNCLMAINKSPIVHKKKSGKMEDRDRGHWSKTQVTDPPVLPLGFSPKFTMDLVRPKKWQWNSLGVKGFIPSLFSGWQVKH